MLLKSKSNWQSMNQLSGWLRYLVLWNWLIEVMLVCFECFDCGLNGYWLKKCCGCDLICKREEGWGKKESFYGIPEVQLMPELLWMPYSLVRFFIIIIIIINMEWMQFVVLCLPRRDEAVRVDEADDDDDDDDWLHLSPINSHELWDFSYVWKHKTQHWKLKIKGLGIQMWDLQNSNIRKDLPTCTQKLATQHGCWL